MFRLILVIFAIMLIAAVIGIDACTCGHGPVIRQNLKELFGSKKETKTIIIKEKAAPILPKPVTVKK